MVAPLYTTDSGLLFHAGKILILTVGLPARGKTHISRALERYLRWMGVKTQVVSLGDHRRKTLGGAQKLPHDYFTPGKPLFLCRIHAGGPGLMAFFQCIQEKRAQKPLRWGKWYRVDARSWYGTFSMEEDRSSFTMPITGQERRDKLSRRSMLRRGFMWFT
jgi:hypothetical protein